MIWIIFIGIALLSYIVSQSLENKFKRFSKEPIALTGKQVAEQMLRDHGITDVQVVSTRGHLTDHYNPQTKTVNLSESVYGSASVAAAAVAAHECGHAVQHQVAYAPLSLRSALVPAVNFASKFVSWVLLAGIILVESFPQVLEAGIILFALTTLFAFVTLPVEINASKRALAWLDKACITPTDQAQRDAESALRSAAYTYVVAALSSLATLIYYILILNSRRD